MFGLFKKKNYTRELIDLLLIQHDTIKELIQFLMIQKHKDRQDKELNPDNICGEWVSGALGISVNIKKGENGCYVSVDNLNTPFSEFTKRYKLMEYNGIYYFILKEYAVFLKYEKDRKTIVLEGNIELVNSESYVDDLTSQINPN